MGFRYRSLILPFSEVDPFMVECVLKLPSLSPNGGKSIVARFDGGSLLSDAVFWFCAKLSPGWGWRSDWRSVSSNLSLQPR